jgi:peptidylprolyl isomerase
MLGKDPMTIAKNGDTVKVHYTGTLDDGTVFDSSMDREPLEFKLGEKQMIPGFEAGVLGMEVDETKTVKIVSDDAYGAHHDERVIEIPRSEVPADMTIQLGQTLELAGPDGQSVIVQVKDITDEIVKLDANHPLAGQDLNFEIKLIEIA